MCQIWSTQSLEQLLHKDHTQDPDWQQLHRPNLGQEYAHAHTVKKFVMKGSTCTCCSV